MARQPRGRRPSGSGTREAILAAAKERFAELGYPEFTAKVWFGLLVKKDTPPEIVKRYTDAAVKAHNDPAVKAKLESQGFEVSGATGPDKLRDEIKKQTARWGQLVKASGFSVEDRGSTK